MVSSDNIIDVNEALLALERAQDPLWSLPLVDALESQCMGKALEWSCAVVSEALRASDDRVTLRQSWLTELLELMRSSPDSEDFGRRAREIWYHENNRDEVQTAISRLYEALAVRQGGDITGYRRWIAVAVGLVAGGPPRDNRAVQRTIDLFRKYSGVP